MVKRVKPKTQMIGINIGTTKEAIIEARNAIIAILESDTDQSTKVAALETLRMLCQTNSNNCTISNNIIKLDTEDNEDE